MTSDGLIPMFSCATHGNIGSEVFSIEVPGYKAKRDYCLHCIIDMLDKNVKVALPMGMGQPYTVEPNTYGEES